MEPLSEPHNTVWSFPFTPQDWVQTPLAVQAYVRTLRDEVARQQHVRAAEPGIATAGGHDLAVVLQGDAVGLAARSQGDPTTRE